MISRGGGGQPGTVTSTGSTLATAPQRGVALAEDAAGAAAVADRHHQPGFRRRLVGAPQRRLHVARDRAGHEQHVGMARAGDELDAQPFQVVVGIVQGVDLQLAAVARAGVHLADGQRLAQDVEDVLVDALHRLQFVAGRERRRLGADAGARDLSDDLPLSLEVVSRVAEVEGFVDQRKVRHDVADHRVFEHRPVLPRRIVAMAARNAGHRPPAPAPRRPRRASPRPNPRRSRCCRGSSTAVRTGAARQLVAQDARTGAATRMSPGNARPRARPRRRSGGRPC